MDKVYVYGSQKYVARVEQLLNTFGIEDYDIINSTSRIKDLIVNDNEQFFLIDEEKIYKPMFFYKWLQFLVPKDGIESDFLENNTKFDFVFESMQSAVEYIANNFQTKNNKVYHSNKNEIEEVGLSPNSEIGTDNEVNEIETTHERDMSEITELEDIKVDEMQKAIFDSNSYIEETKDGYR